MNIRLNPTTKIGSKIWVSTCTRWLVYPSTLVDVGRGAKSHYFLAGQWRFQARNHNKQKCKECPSNNHGDMEAARNKSSGRLCSSSRVFPSSCSSSHAAKSINKRCQCSSLQFSQAEKETNGRYWMAIQGNPPNFADVSPGNSMSSSDRFPLKPTGENWGKMQRIFLSKSKGVEHCSGINMACGNFCLARMPKLHGRSSTALF